MEDKERLLTDEEIRVMETRCRHPVGDEGYIGRTGVNSRAKFYSTDNKKLYELLIKVQDAKTAKIFEARIEALVEEIKQELNNILGMCSERSPRWRSVVLALEGMIDSREYFKATHTSKSVTMPEKD